MKNSKSFLTWENLKWSLGVIVLTFFTWLLEKIFNKLFSKIETMVNNILSFIGNIELTSFEKVTGILCLLTLFIMWLVWYFKEYRKYKNQYFDMLEAMIVENKVDIKCLQLQVSTGQKDLDLLTIGRNFSDEGMKVLGLSPTQIYKANQYLKQKYGYEPNRDNPKS